MKIVRKEIILPNETDLICWWKGREKRKGRQSAIVILSDLITSTTIPFVNVYAINKSLFILLFLKRPLKSHLARPRPSVLTASLLSANWPLAHLFRPHTTSSSSPFTIPSMPPFSPLNPTGSWKLCDILVDVALFIGGTTPQRTFQGRHKDS